MGLDISDRKRAEEALTIAEENYRSIFENALEGIFQSSPEGRFIEFRGIPHLPPFVPSSGIIRASKNILPRLEGSVLRWGWIAGR